MYHFLYLDVGGIVEAVDDALSGDDRRDFRRDVRPYIENLSAFLLTTSVTANEVRASVILTAVE